MDSSLYTSSTLKATVDRLRGLADKTHGLLTGRESVFSKQAKFDELQRLADDSKTYLDQYKNNYLGTRTTP